MKDSRPITPNFSVNRSEISDWHIGYLHNAFSNSPKTYLVSPVSTSQKALIFPVFRSLNCCCYKAVVCQELCWKSKLRLFEDNHVVRLRCIQFNCSIFRI